MSKLVEQTEPDPYLHLASEQVKRVLCKHTQGILEHVNMVLCYTQVYTSLFSNVILIVVLCALKEELFNFF
jgi:hypothetical protein